MSGEPKSVEELDSALQEDAVKSERRRDGLSAGVRAMMIGAALMGDLPAGAPGSRAGRFMKRVVDRQLKDDANHWRESSTDFTAQALAKAEAKRARRKAARIRPPEEAAVEHCWECGRSIAECDKGLCSRTRKTKRRGKDPIIVVKAAVPVPASVAKVVKAME